MKKPWEIHHDESVGEEGGMALSNLNRSQSMISQLQNIIDSEDSLPAWVQGKINSVYDDINDVHGYMSYLDDEYESEDDESEFEDGEKYYDIERHDDSDDEFSDEHEEDDYEEEDVVEGDLLERKRRKKKKGGLWANIWARRRAGKRPKRPGEKGYPKTLDIGESLIREVVQLMLEKRKKKKKKKCKGTESSPVGSPRQRSFCKRMCGMRRVNTGSKTAGDPDSCINQALRRWKCRCRKLRL